MFLVNVIKTITPSCLTLTFCPLSTVEPWLLLSSSVSKFNNHEKKNITCGKFIPFSFASYYPNSPLILYHYYPPANDRVGVTVPLNTPLTKHKMHPKPNCNSSSRLSGPWFGTPFSSPWCEPLQRDGLARELSEWQLWYYGCQEVRAKLSCVWWDAPGFPSDSYTSPTHRFPEQGTSILPFKANRVWWKMDRGQILHS